MSQWTLFAFSGLGVALVSLQGLFMSEHPLRKIIAANLLGSGVFLVLIALARRGPGASPDPVPHALVLTGIVVSVSATALALTLARRLNDAREEAAPHEKGQAEAADP